MILIAHTLEHLAQVIQLYGLHWPRTQSMGILGLWLPFLIRTEALHLGYALLMLAGLAYWGYRKTFNYQLFHTFEHCLLFAQFVLGVPLVERVSLGNIFLPRIELHFIYNLIVLILMLLEQKHYLLEKY